jgi:hypothetical protein
LTRHSARASASQGRRGGRLATTVAAVLALAGAVGLGFGYEQWRASSRPPAELAAPGGTAPASSAPGSSARPSGGLTLARSVPVRLDIPAIGVHTSLMQLGLNSDRTVQVPPIESNSPAGWYQFSPTPGQLGPSVILGHVTLGNFGPGVFFRLAALHTGDKVSVSRADGSVAVFSVDQTAEYPKEKFPSQAVYGNIDHAGLRLITCGGPRNPTTHAYTDNVVVFASLVSATSAKA